MLISQNDLCSSLKFNKEVKPEREVTAVNASLLFFFFAATVVIVVVLIVELLNALCAL